VSIADPDARPIRKGKLGKPTEFGYVAQICEVTENTRRGAREFILPAGHAPGNPAENTLPPQTAAELQRARIRPREIVADGGFLPAPTKEALPDLATSESTSPTSMSPPPVAPKKAAPDTASGSKDESVTSSAATGCAARA
jgi:transposase, IS5 family